VEKIILKIMIIIKCDRCGKEFQPNPQQEPFFEGILIEKKTQMIDSKSPLASKFSSLIKPGQPLFIEEMSQRKIQLCPTCTVMFAEILKKFLQGETKK
jgi:hypothetical protein